MVFGAKRIWSVQKPYACRQTFFVGFVMCELGMIKCDRDSNLASAVHAAFFMAVLWICLTSRNLIFRDPLLLDLRFEPNICYDIGFKFLLHAAAIQCLKRKRLYEQQVEQLGNFQLRIHDQV